MATPDNAIAVNPNMRTFFFFLIDPPRKMLSTIISKSIEISNFITSWYFCAIKKGVGKNSVK